VVLKNSRPYVQTGAGGVADSVPVAEYDETENKAAAMMQALNMARASLSYRNKRAGCSLQKNPGLGQHRLTDLGLIRETTRLIRAPPNYSFVQNKMTLARPFTAIERRMQRNCRVFVNFNFPKRPARLHQVNIDTLIAPAWAFQDRPFSRLAIYNEPDFTPAQLFGICE
jgi:hypothetical protein